MAYIDVPEPAWKLSYRGRDITADLIPCVTRVRYTDKLSGESDEVEVEIEDRDGRWKSGWFPDRGDELTLSIGYAGQRLYSIGAFELDEISFSGPPDTACLRAVSAGVSKTLRTEVTGAYEGESLRSVAQRVAERNGLILVGGGDNPARTYERITQHKERDLTFLNRLGENEGILFTVKDGKLIWHDQGELDRAAAYLTLNRTDVTSFSIRAVTATTYKACRVMYHDPATKTLMAAEAPGEGIPSGDDLRIVSRCETGAQAQAKADAALRKANGPQVEADIRVFGNPVLRAGVNVALGGFGKLDRVYQIVSACHSIDRSSGYVTDVSLAVPTAKGAL